MQAFAKAADCDVETRDISLAGPHPRQLPGQPRAGAAADRRPGRARRAREDARSQHHQAAEHQRVGAAAARPRSRSCSSRATRCPTIPRTRRNDAEKTIKARYAKVLGSAVNPVLREGNSDRRVAAVGEAVREEAPALDGRVEQGLEDARRAHERRRLLRQRAVGRDREGRQAVDRAHVDARQDDRAEGRRRGAGRRVHRRHVDEPPRAARLLREARSPTPRPNGVLLSLHLKATMMKVSDPIMFGHAVERVLQGRVREARRDVRRSSASTRTTASATCTRRSKTLPAPNSRPRSRPTSTAVYEARPPLAMVDSSKGITNLHVPSDVIIDASMPAAIRTSGQMWGPDGKLHDTKAMIPDRCYAGVYQETIDDCKKNGAFDVPHHGQRVERRPDGAGGRRVRLARQDVRDRRPAAPCACVDADGKTLIEHAVEEGDIWRMCQTKDVADPRLGQARRESRARHGPARDLLARREPRLRPQRDRRSAAATCRTTTPPASTSASCRRSRRRARR